jgi:hypothetical protein
MNYLNQQAQLFLVASLLMLAGCFCLYIALAFWIWAIDRFLSIIGISGALVAFLDKKENRDAWWSRVATWLYRARDIHAPDWPRWGRKP